MKSPGQRTSHPGRSQEMVDACEGGVSSG
jgi:hypothetical protein